MVVAVLGSTVPSATWVSWDWLLIDRDDNIGIVILARPTCVALLVTAWFAAPLRATTFYYTVGPVAVGGQTINASASFELDSVTNVLTVSLLNLQDNPVAAGQLLSGLTFTLAGVGATPVSNPTVTDNPVTILKVDSSGLPYEVSTLTNNDWAIDPKSSVGSNYTYDFCTVCKEDGSNPSPQSKMMLIGAPASNGSYTAANGSIRSNNGHMPYILATGDALTSGSLAGKASNPSWHIDFGTGSILTSSTTITAVTFRFGSTYGQVTKLGSLVEPPDPDPPSVPEPGTVALFAFGGLMLAVNRWQSKKRKTA